MVVLVKNNFLFGFQFVIQFLPLSSMDEKEEAEPKIALDKYYLYYVMMPQKQCAVMAKLF